MKRSLAILAVPLAVLGFAACGDDDDDDTPGSTQPDDTDATDDTEITDDTEVTDDTGSDDTLPGGITVPSLPGGTLPGGITLPSLPDISIPDISVPDTESLLRQFFPNLDDDQVSCLSDALGDIGTDVDPSEVMAEVTSVLDDCNINVSDLTGGG